jgi:serine/threonine-protein kinase
MALPHPELEGKYEILEKIGEGGMGAVYKVRHLLLDELRVIKVVRPQQSDRSDFERRFIREARIATRLHHQYITSLYDFNLAEDGTAYMVLEYVDGLTLRQILSQHGPPPLGLTLHVAEQALRALTYLHQKSIVHRDISPDNIMLTVDLGRPVVKLIDLGIAKDMDLNSALTMAQAIVGKLTYAAPEAFQHGSREIDHRCDLYSFGIVLYEMLTGVLPVEGNSPASLMAGHLMRPIRSFEETDAEGRVPYELREAVAHSLEKNPDDRPQSAGEMLAEVREARDAADPRPVSIEEIGRLLSLDVLRVEIPRKPATTQHEVDAAFGPVPTDTTDLDERWPSHSDEHDRSSAGFEPPLPVEEPPPATHEAPPAPRPELAIAPDVDEQSAGADLLASPAGLSDFDLRPFADSPSPAENPVRHPPKGRDRRPFLAVAGVVLLTTAATIGMLAKTQDQERVAVALTRLRALVGLGQPEPEPPSQQEPPKPEPPPTMADQAAPVAPPPLGTARAAKQPQEAAPQPGSQPTAEIVTESEPEQRAVARAETGFVVVNARYQLALQIDGKSRRPSFNHSVEAPVGRRSVTLYAPDVYYSDEKSFYLSPGERYELKVPDPVSVRVVTEPAGVRISLQGRPVGTTPMNFTVVPGEYLLSFEGPGIQPRSVTRTIGPEDSSIRIELD